MKKIVFLFSIICLEYAIGQTLAPDVIGSSGGSAAFSSGNISWTLGEPVSDTHANQYLVTKGFHQPTHIYLTSVPVENAGGIYAYPNPVQDHLVIDFRGMKAGTYSITLYDELGKLLRQSIISIEALPESEKLDLTEYAEGLYLVRVECSALKQSKLFKITKQK